MDNYIILICVWQDDERRRKMRRLQAVGGAVYCLGKEGKRWRGG